MYAGRPGGEGTFPARRDAQHAAKVEADQGPGAVRGAIEAAMKRLIGGTAVRLSRWRARLIAEMRRDKPAGGHNPKAEGLQLSHRHAGEPFVEEKRGAAGRSESERTHARQKTATSRSCRQPALHGEGAGMGLG